MNRKWGRKHGSIYKDGSLGIRQRQWGSGATRDGKGIERRFRWPMRRRLMAQGNLRLLLLARDNG